MKLCASVHRHIRLSRGTCICAWCVCCVALHPFFLLCVGCYGNDDDRTTQIYECIYTEYHLQQSGWHTGGLNIVANTQIKQHHIHILIHIDCILYFNFSIIFSGYVSLCVWLCVPLFHFVASQPFWKYLVGIYKMAVVIRENCLVWFLNWLVWFMTNEKRINQSGWKLGFFY